MIPLAIISSDIYSRTVRGFMEFPQKLDFKDVLIVPQNSALESRSEVELETSFRFINSKSEWSGIPIAAANMDTVGTLEALEVLGKHKLLTCLHKHYSFQNFSEFFRGSKKERLYKYAAISTGTRQKDLNTPYNVLSSFTKISFVCIDVANGYTRSFLKAIREFRRNFPKSIILAGNVVTPERTVEVLSAGADIGKIGIGPGSACTTRIKTGIGYPQFSAVMECAEAAHDFGGHIMSDGGCSSPGDVAKAFAAGADFVMLGGMFAGHEESGGTLVKNEDGRYFKKFYGMSSKEAMEKHSGGVANYRSSEGRSLLIPFKGSIEPTVLDILGGVRSACTYVGAWDLPSLRRKARFIKVNSQYNQVFERFTQ